MMRAARKLTKELDVKEEFLVMEMVDVIEPSGTPDRRPQGVGVVKQERETVYKICSIYIVDL